MDPQQERPLRGSARGTARGRAAKGIPNYVDAQPALRGFAVEFRNKADHQLDEFAVELERGNVRVAFNDKNDDDLFDYTVDAVLLRTE